MNLDGKVARLTSLEVPKERKQAEKESRKRKHEETKPEAPLTIQEQWERAQSGLTTLVGDEAAKSAIALLQYWQDESKHTEASTEYEKFCVLPAVADKDARRALHELIRSQLAFCALADTQDGRVRIWHKQFEKVMPNYGKFDRNNNNSRRQKSKWPSDRPDYLQFVMYKENMDTGFACKEIVQRINQRKVRIAYAGMKDKRGVTTQFCTLYRQEPQALAGINRGGRGGGNTTGGGVGILRVGNFEFVEKELSLGSLIGNRFDIVLRNVDVSTAKDEERIPLTKQWLEAAALALRVNGFINYFGMQRFGKYYDTHKVGLCILNGDFKGAVDIIMQPKTDEMSRYAMARDKWAKRFDKLADDVNAESREKAELDCAREVSRNLGRFMTCEMAILNSLVRKPCDYRRAFGSVPKTMRMMFLHAVQSLVWNHVASFRIDKLGRDIVVGDLAMIDEDKTEGGEGSAENEKVIKVVTADDIASKKYSMTDVVLPLVGTKVQYPENESGELFDTLLIEYGITKQLFHKVQDRDFSLKGDYRKLVCKPTDVDFEIQEYTNPLQPLIKTDFMELEEESSNQNPDKQVDANEREGGAVLLGMVVGFTLPSSSYATIALRELMKRPTSSEYQSQLKLEGRCEANVASATQESENGNKGI